MDGSTVLFVGPETDADSNAVSTLRSALEEPTVLSRRSLAETESLARDQFIDCVVTEHDLPDGTGFDLVNQVREFSPDTAFILFTDADTTSLPTETLDGTIVDHLPRGVPDAALRLAHLVRVTVARRSQTAYPLPQHEAARLAAIEEYGLDTATLVAPLDRLSRLAAVHFEADIASVNIIKEHEQVFLACHGADWTPTARDESICTHTILGEDDLMIVEDVRDDPRFQDIESLQHAGIRAYMGATLTNDEGHTLGTLCVYNDEPRSFTTEEADYLQLLARVTMDLIELNYRGVAGGEP